MCVFVPMSHYIRVVTTSSKNKSVVNPAHLFASSAHASVCFTIYINCLDYDIQDANFHFYADDSGMYCSASSGKQALYKLQSAFDVIQSRIYNLKLVLNVDKTKYMLFSGSKKIDKNVSSLQTLQGTVIESVKEYKYIGIIVIIF